MGIVNTPSPPRLLTQADISDLCRRLPPFSLTQAQQWPVGTQLLGSASPPAGSGERLLPPRHRAEGGGREAAASYKKLEVLFPSKAS